MNIIDAIEKIKSGEKITKLSWNNGAIQLAQTDENNYQLFASGETTQEMLLLLSNDFEVVAND